MKDEPKWDEPFDSVQRRDADPRDERDETEASEAGEPPEFIWKLMEAIERGTWPVEIPFGIENIAQPPNMQLRSTLFSDASEPEFPSLSLRGVYRLSREKVQEFVVSRIRSARRAGGPVLVSLCLLSRIDRACFLELAAETFVDLLRTSSSKLPEDDPLASLVVDLHEFDPELLPELVAHTARADRIAGQRLRSLLLEALADPACADQLGLLTAQALCDQLESL